MGLEGTINYKLLVGGIFAILIFGLVGSQDAMAGAGDIDINKCVAFTEDEARNVSGCGTTEGSARSIITLEEGDTGFFRIEANRVEEASVSSILVQDKLPAGLEFVQTIQVSGNSYTPSTGVWDVGTINEGSFRTLIIEFKVSTGTCDSELVNTASLTSAVSDTNDSNDSDSATVQVDEDCPIDRGELLEIHCEEVTTTYTTFSKRFGQRGVDNGGDIIDCDYTWENLAEPEEHKVELTGIWVASQDLQMCDNFDNANRFLQSVLILEDEDGDRLVISESGNLCFIERIKGVGKKLSLDGGDGNGRVITEDINPVPKVFGPIDGSDGKFAGLGGSVMTSEMTIHNSGVALTSIWVIFEDPGQIVEVHCDEVFMDWDLFFNGELTGFRGPEGPSDLFKCIYVYESGLEEFVAIVGAGGEFTLDLSEEGVCEEIFGLLVTGQIILLDFFGNELTLEHIADLCFVDVFEIESSAFSDTPCDDLVVRTEVQAQENGLIFLLQETPGGTGTVNGEESSGIFSGLSGNVETHRCILPLGGLSPGDLVDAVRAGDVGASVDLPDLFGLSFGTIWVEFDSGIIRSSGSSGHSNPSLGWSSDGTRKVGTNCGLGVDGVCYPVSKLYHQDFEILELFTSPHTITNDIYCSQGWQTCNHVIIAFMGMDEWFPSTLMKVEAHKRFDGNWEITWDDPDDYISDPGDVVPGDITFVPQIIDDKILGTSFTIDFKNKDTGQLKLGIQTRDSSGGVSNTYFNEGVEFKDSDAYPSVEAVYDEPIDVEPLCFGQNNNDRNSCAFAKIKDWATANAEDALRQMTNGQYQYEQ